MLYNTVMTNYNVPYEYVKIEGDPVCPACGEPYLFCTRAPGFSTFWCKNYHQWHYSAKITRELREDGRMHISKITEIVVLDKLTETEYNKVVSWVDQSKLNPKNKEQ